MMWNGKMAACLTETARIEQSRWAQMKEYRGKEMATRSIEVPSFSHLLA